MESYDDEYDDDRYYREKDMDRLSSDRQREIKYDDKDREKEAREAKVCISIPQISARSRARLRTIITLADVSLILRWVQ